MKASKLGMLAVVVVTALSSVGCAIHQQAPIREVAYDFSDHDFYDRAYAPSPNYAATDVDVRPRRTLVGVRGRVSEVEQGSHLVPLPAGAAFMGAVEIAADAD